MTRVVKAKAGAKEESDETFVALEAEEDTLKQTEAKCTIVYIS